MGISYDGIGVGARSNRSPLRTVRAHLPHTALQSGSSLASRLARFPIGPLKAEQPYPFVAGHYGAPAKSAIYTPSRSTRVGTSIEPSMSDIPSHIVFVCTANTCRSPMAAALFRHALDAQDDPLKSLTVSSAGVSAVPGQPANPNSVKAMQKVGVTLDGHRSQPLDQELVDRALAFFCMTDSHLAMLSYQINPAPQNAFLMRQFLPDGQDSQIPDPFGGSLAEYEACRDAMVEAIPSLLEVVKKLCEANQR